MNNLQGYSSGSQYTNSPNIGPQSVEIVPTLGFLAPWGTVSQLHPLVQETLFVYCALDAGRMPLPVVAGSKAVFRSRNALKAGIITRLRV